MVFLVLNTFTKVLRSKNVFKPKHIRFISPLTAHNSIYIQKENIILQKFNELNAWYIRLTGLDEVKRLQDRVIDIQLRLEKVQDKRREVGRLLEDKRRRSSELQEQLYQIDRRENEQRFFSLIKQETVVIREEKELSIEFGTLDKTEREIFTSLSNAVRDSHEKEKAQSEYTKYWGIILSIVGTIIGAGISTIISTIRNRQIVGGMENKLERILSEQKLQLEQALRTKTFVALDKDRFLNLKEMRSVIVNTQEETINNHYKQLHNAIFNTQEEMLKVHYQQLRTTVYITCAVMFVIGIFWRY